MKKKFYDSFLKKIAPAGQIIAYKANKEVYFQAWGKKYRYFDLASLTKIFFTNEAIRLALQMGFLCLEDPIYKHLPFWNNQVKIKNLLQHDSGYPWWQAFYKSIPQDWDSNLKYMALKNNIAKIKPKKEKKCLYSDLDYFVLAFIIEAVFNKPLLHIFKLIDSPFHFNPLKTYKKLYAPTQFCTFRNKRLQGEVDDLNTWALGGVAPHAGLFGGRNEIGQWYNSFRMSCKNNKWQKKMIQRAVPSKKGDWALGFMMPSQDLASCGKYFSKHSIGHLGFTGNSFWYDPKKDFAICILSNRVYYGAKHSFIREARPIIHNQIVKEILC